ncbi:MAG: hypothetical protein KVP17_000790 [Porospora cf. gigantea B]|uniref:uncharacterized protein n=1 Tax=Porospora cf. gigantea B TaxID=2853592 RepID=UPI003571DB57|nr:MAG: hypothetical protein KVP17_000790 [Porospora cf. gigantea B]
MSAHTGTADTNQPTLIAKENQGSLPYLYLQDLPRSDELQNQLIRVLKHKSNITGSEVNYEACTQKAEQITQLIANGYQAAITQVEYDSPELSDTDLITQCNVRNYMPQQDTQCEILTNRKNLHFEAFPLDTYWSATVKPVATPEAPFERFTGVFARAARFWGCATS